MTSSTSLLLVDQPATAAHQRVIGACCAALTLVALWVLPMASQPLDRLPQVVGMCGTLLGITDLMTFLLLATRVGNEASPSIRTIACAYLFSGLMALLHLATFPGAVRQDAPLIGNPGMVGWLFILWRVGFSLMLLVGVSRAHAQGTHFAARPASVALWRAILLTVAASAASLGLALWLSQLPLSLITADTFGQVSLSATWLAAVLCVVALVVVWYTRRLRRVLYLWLGFVLLANALGMAMSETGGIRYTLGWYAARGYAVLASVTMLALLLAEVLKLQRSLSWTVTQLGEHAESLQTEIHRREAAERRLARAQQLEVMGQLAGGLAHDFNNHLHVIGTRLELLRRRAGNVPGVGDDLRVLNRTLRRSEGLTRQLLSVSGRRALQPCLLNLNEWLPPCLDLLRSLLRGGMTLVLVPSPVRCEVEVDPGELESALANLVTNARDAMDGKAGPITVTLRTLDEEVEIAVADAGHGMPESVMQRVFEPFFSTKGSGKGYGLGMSQIQSFAGRSLGNVSIDSQPGKGTTVTLRLPRASDTAARPTADAPTEPSAPSPSAQSRRIGAGTPVLVVDDNEDLAASISTLLEQLGFVVRHVSDAQQALELLRNAAFGPRIVISDIVMPGALSGLELAHRVRREFPDVAVILSTAYSQSANAALAEGFPLLMKPYQPQELERRMLAALHCTVE